MANGVYQLSIKRAGVKNLLDKLEKAGEIGAINVLIKHPETSTHIKAHKSLMDDMRNKFSLVLNAKADGLSLEETLPITKNILEELLINTSLELQNKK
jgi:hypothetical protein